MIAANGFSGLSTPPKVGAKGAAKEFMLPLASLDQWSAHVQTTLNNVKISGHSPVHDQANDCEMHLGATSSDFAGNPNGLVLEPMNACCTDLPTPPTGVNVTSGPQEWTGWGDQLVKAQKVVTATGVPRIWPEHLIGGGASNPNHAVELHPLVTLAQPGGTKEDFTKNIFAGTYQGGLKEASGESILKNLKVSVTTVGSQVTVSFAAGTIGNFCTMSVSIQTASIVADTDGSLRMTGSVTLVDGTTVPVHMLSVAGSPINTDIAALRNATGDQTIHSLVLFSLSPEALDAAAHQSSGQAVQVAVPVQLILYGEAEDSEGGDD